MTSPEHASRNTIDGLSYADAGVDIDAGDALVESIKPLGAGDHAAGRVGWPRRLWRAVRP